MPLGKDTLKPKSNVRNLKIANKKEIYGLDVDLLKG